MCFSECHKDNSYLCSRNNKNSNRETVYRTIILSRGIKATMKKIITCLLTVFGITSACGQGNFENADVKGFAELIADSSVVILDVRTAEEYADGHIKGAILIDQKQGDFVEKAKATLSKEKTIAIYCRSGRRSANAADRLAAEGYRLVNLKGGIIAWTDEGMPITKE